MVTFFMSLARPRIYIYAHSLRIIPQHEFVAEVE